MKRGVWFCVWPIDDTFDGICLLGYESGLGGLLPLLLEHDFWPMMFAMMSKTTKSRSVNWKLSLINVTLMIPPSSRIC
jgi:hypothetical protein